MSRSGVSRPAAEFRRARDIPQRRETADIAAYDQGDAHMLIFAGVLTKGILKQFPDKFKK